MQHPYSEQRPGDVAADQIALYRLAWFIGLALILAMIAPPPLFAATLSSMLGLASLMLALGAMLLREPALLPHLTRWDVAAILYVLSVAFGWFVDDAEVSDFLKSQGFAS
jgi:hypothetical protein